MNSEIIGSWAGIVWQILNEKGPMKIKDIKKEAKLREKDVYAAIGWLAREQKVTFAVVDGDKEETVALA